MLEYWIWLHELKGLTLKDKHRLLSVAKTPEAVFGREPSDYPDDFLSSEGFRNLVSQKSLDQAFRIIEKNEAYSIGTLTMTELKDFTSIKSSPKTAERLPLVLYCRGKPNTNQKSWAVVGTRSSTVHGYRTTVAAVTQLVNRGFCINSGLAVGIDGVAHGTALKVNGKTQGFAACGLDQCYPKAHSELMAAIVEVGAVFSPFCVGTAPVSHHFYRRNELMALFSDHILVTEAGVHSGAMITLNYGKQLDRPLYSVPSELLPLVKQNRALFKRWGVNPLPMDWFKAGESEYGGFESNVLKCLETQDMNVDELAKLLSISDETVELCLFQLALNQIVVLLSHGKWRKMR